MNVFVTGATGYIGGAVTRALLGAGHQVTALVRPTSRAGLPQGVSAVVGDLTAPAEWLDQARTHDAMIHTAFPAHGAAWADGVRAESAVLGQLAAAKIGQCTKLFLTNGSIFLGDSASERHREQAPIAEGHPAAIRGESLAQARRDIEGAVEVRLASFVYGFGGSVFLPLLLRHAVTTGRVLLVDGHEHTRISTLHVTAAADAFVRLLASKDASGTYHVSSEEEPSVSQLATALANNTGAKLVRVSAEEAAEELNPFAAMFLTTNNRLSARRIRTLGWSHEGFDPLLWDVAFGSYLRTSS
ncbi:MAG: NAD-dependent epimerase/dehydratase family protein [Myxococcota bacterium]